MNKTKTAFNWNSGYVKTRELNRSFKTLQEAEMFAKGKDTRDIYISKGRYVVVWLKQTALR